MKKVYEILVTELLKLRRSKITWLLFAAFSLAPFALALFMFIMKDPENAKRMGLIGQKAMLVGGAADWLTLSSMIRQMFGTIGYMILSIIVTFLYGREYNEGTAKVMLSLPISRIAIVLVKYVLASLWFVVLCLVVYGECLVAGFASGLGPLSPEMFAGLTESVLRVSVAWLCAGPLIALLAMVGRGYLAPLGVAMLTMGIGAIFAHTGWAPWVPWTIVPALGASDIPNVETPSIIVILCFFAASLAGAVYYLKRADNHQ